LSHWVIESSDHLRTVILSRVFCGEGPRGCLICPGRCKAFSANLQALFVLSVSRIAWLLPEFALALIVMNNGCTEYQMPWWRGLRRIWSWRRRTVASPVSLIRGDHDPVTGESYYRMLPTDDGGESYQMECLLCKAQGNVLASRFTHEDNCPLRRTEK